MISWVLQIFLLWLNVASRWSSFSTFTDQTWLIATVYIHQYQLHLDSIWLLFELLYFKLPLFFMALFQSVLEAFLRFWSTVTRQHHTSQRCSDRTASRKCSSHLYTTTRREGSHLQPELYNTQQHLSSLLVQSWWVCVNSSFSFLVRFRDALLHTLLVTISSLLILLWQQGRFTELTVFSPYQIICKL